MSSVTYKNQPAINKTKGAVPLAGNSHIYTVTKLLWPKEVERFIEEKLLIGKSLHLCCGKSKIGSTRLDLYEEDVDIRADSSHLPFADKSFDTVLSDVPYNGKLGFLHKTLEEMARVSKKRIIWQMWNLPSDKLGRFRKDHSFLLTGTYIWQPQTYFGRVNVISVFDRIGKND